MLRFFKIDKDYVDYLRRIDSKVPSLNYETHDKFFCGIVLQITDKKYYAPISHETSRQQTSLLIYDGNRAISSIKFAFMLPAPDFVLSPLDFNEIARTDRRYADLLRAEYSFCSRHRQDIYRKAASVYNIGCNRQHRLNNVCCQFLELEKCMEEYLEGRSR